MAITLVADDEFAAAHLASGRVKIPGVEVVATGSGPLYLKAITDPPYDVMVVPLVNFVIAKDLGRPVTGIPVYPDMFFPHLGARVADRAGISSPKDLEGKKVTTRGFGFNPAVWMRGALVHQYDVSIEKIEWVEEEPNSMSGVAFPRSRRFAISRGGNAEDALGSGEADAAFYGRGGPAPFGGAGHLFADPLKEALAYREMTGVFPHNTVMIAKSEVMEANPSLGPTVVDACNEAWDIYCEEAADTDDHMGIPIKFLRANGMFPRRNDLAGSHGAVSTLIAYAYEQGLIKRLWTPEELFFEGAK
jgi:4,5-dihydroxyphthalate decarboxylase